MSVKAAVAACKRFLADPQTSRIRLADLITEEARRVCKELNSVSFTNTSEDVTAKTVTVRVRRYDTLLQTLVGLAFQCGRWGDVQAMEYIADVQRRLYWTRGSQGLTLWLAYQAYPVSLVTFAALLGAAIQERCNAIKPLITNSLESPSRQPVLAVDVVPPYCLLSEEPRRWGQFLEGKGNRLAPVNEWICEVLWSQLGEEFTSKADFELKFDWVEVMLAMANHKLCPAVFNPEYHPPGSFSYRGANLDRVVKLILQSLDTSCAESQYVTSQLIGTTAEQGKQAVAEFQAWSQKLRGQWF